MVIIAVANGVALTTADDVAVAVVLRKNDTVPPVNGETHSVPVRENTVKQVLEKDGITVGEYDVVAPPLDTKITNGMETSVLHGRQLQLTIDGEVRTVWITSRTVDDALTQLNSSDPGSKLFTSRSAAIGREGLLFSISTPKNATVDAAGTPAKLRAVGIVDDALTAAKATLDEDDAVTPIADTSLIDGLAISYTNAKKRATTKEGVVFLGRKEKKSDELEEGKTGVVTEDVSGTKAQNPAEVYHSGTLVFSELQNEQVIKEPVVRVTKVDIKKASKSFEDGSGSDDGNDLGPVNGSPCQASYYWQGQTAASGERFNPSDLTAAYKIPPLGSKVKVINPNSGKTVVVRINDRDPYVAGRCLGLPKVAMETIGGASSGVITVNYGVLRRIRTWFSSPSLVLAESLHTPPYRSLMGFEGLLSLLPSRLNRPTVSFFQAG